MNDCSFPEYIPQELREYYDSPDLSEISERDRACLLRLIEYEPMCAVYEHLDSTFRKEFDVLAEDERGESAKSHIGRRIVAFIHCAWSANIDFGPHRSDRKNAPGLLDEIRTTAVELAELLRRFDEMKLPSSVYIPSVRQLLERTDNPRDPSWSFFRRHILGTSVAQGIDDDEPTEDEQGKSEHEATRIRHAWSVAPELSGLLSTLAQHSRLGIEQTNPTDMIGAALVSKKRNVKTEYIRAFIKLLMSEHHIRFTGDVIHAVATTAEVVIDDADIMPNYDDVRKLVIQLGGHPPETWSSEDSIRKT